MRLMEVEVAVNNDSDGHLTLNESLWRTQEPVPFTIQNERSLFYLSERQDIKSSMLSILFSGRFSICSAIKLKTELPETSATWIFTAKCEINCCSPEPGKKYSPVQRSSLKRNKPSAAFVPSTIPRDIRGHRGAMGLTKVGVLCEHQAWLKFPQCPRLYLYYLAESLGRKPILNWISA